MLDALLPPDNLETVDGRNTATSARRSSTPDSWDRLASSQDSDPDREVKVTDAFTTTWFGQSTCFLTLDGACILTDPVFASRLVDYLGPKRLRPPPAPLADLLHVDVCLVSHDHYDHLDALVIDYLGNATLWVIPLGLGRLFRSRGVTNFIELDWWQSAVLPVPGAPRVTFCPTMHWSGRTPSTVYRSLWGCYVVQGKTDSFFHCGDTGYVPSLFDTIGRHFGPFSLALLPIVRRSDAARSRSETQAGRLPTEMASRTAAHRPGRRRSDTQGVAVEALHRLSLVRPAPKSGLGTMSPRAQGHMDAQRRVCRVHMLMSQAEHATAATTIRRGISRSLESCTASPRTTLASSRSVARSS
jgi:L-ascorbate metabolism protein UlaG (beta-lactamase superfamily)